MSENTNFNRIGRIEKRMISEDNLGKFDEVMLLHDGIEYEIPRRLARSRIARVFANSMGNIDAHAIDEMLTSTEDAERLAIRIVKSLDSDVAHSLNKNLNNIEIETGIESRSRANDILTERERDGRLERRKSMKERRREKREESMPDVGGVYNAEFDTVEDA